MAAQVLPLALMHLLADLLEPRRLAAGHLEVLGERGLEFGRLGRLGHPRQGLG